MKETYSVHAVDVALDCVTFVADDETRRERNVVVSNVLLS